MTDDIDEQIEWSARKIADTSDRVRAHIARHGPVTGTATSADGTVTFTVAPGGALHQLRIDPDTRLLNVASLAEEIVALSAKATQRAANNLHDSLRGVVDLETHRGLNALGLAEVPETEEEDEDNDPLGWLV